MRSVGFSASSTVARKQLGDVLRPDRDPGEAEAAVAGQTVLKALSSKRGSSKPMPKV